MSKTHMYVFIGGAVLGYFMASTLAQKQPWKLASGLVANL